MDWYDPISLEPIYELPTKRGDGYTKRITVQRAKEEGLLPRVTGIISAVLGDSWSLGQYKARQNILAAEGMFREDGEADDDYIERVLEVAGESARRSRDRGRECHFYLSDFIKTGRSPVDPAFSLLASEFMDLSKALEVDSLTTEKPLGSIETGFAGTPDIYIECRRLEALEGTVDDLPLWCRGPGRIVIDLKTTNLHKFKKPYREHLYQFGGYGNLLNVGEGDLYLQWYADPWTGESRWIVHPEVVRWKDAFMCLYKAWLVETGFDQPDW
jgi:hypothetical protein